MIQLKDAQSLPQITLRDAASQSGSVPMGDGKVLVSVGTERLVTPVPFKASSLYADFVNRQYALDAGSGLDRSTFDDMFTFTRGSAATYFGADGVIRTAAVDELRLDHDPATGDPLGLLIEESRTNKVLQTGDFTISPWVATVAGSSTVTNAGSASGFPVATVSATSNGGGIRQSIIGLSSGKTYAVTFYVGASDASLTLILENGAGSYGTFCSATINAATGATSSVSGFTSVTSAALGAGRLYTAVLPPAGGALIANLEWRLGTSGETMTFGRPQLEEGSFPTSYIPTAGAAVTRAEDACTRTLGVEFTGAGAGFSAFCEFDQGSIIGDETQFSFSDGSNDHQVRGRSTSTPLTRAFAKDSVIGSTASIIGSAASFSVGQQVKLALTISAASLIATAFGGAPLDAPLNGVPTNLTRLDVGRHWNGNFINGHVRSFAYFDQPVDNAELQELTA